MLNYFLELRYLIVFFTVLFSVCAEGPSWMKDMTLAMNIRLHILEKITNGFSPDSIIGRGEYGDVYKVWLMTRYFVFQQMYQH